MDCARTGRFLRALRQQKKMTQREVASALNLSDKTVSKWERGLGCPDVSTLTALAALLNVSVETLLRGGDPENDQVGGNMKKSKYYVCPTCGNISLCTGEAQVLCCGRPLTALEPQKPDEAHTLSIETVEDECFLSANHPMEKDHYIAFVALATGERVILTQLYPEWELQVRLPSRTHGTLLWYCTRHGLFAVRVPSRTP